MNTAKPKEEKETTNAFGTANSALKLGETLAKMASELVTAIGLVPDKRRTEYAKLIDSAFSTFIEQVEGVRRALKEIDEECDKKEKERVVEHLKRLGTSSEWEKMEREMRMCAQIRDLHSRMHEFFGERADKIAGVNRENLLKLTNEMIQATEGRMADYIAQNLSSLADKSALVKKGNLSLKNLRAELTAPIQELTKARMELMRLEVKARDAILAHAA